MLRHGCGYALANAGHDTRAIQAWLGHANIQHTVRYTELLLAQLRSLDAAIDELERTIVADHRRDPVIRLAASVPASARSPLRRFWPVPQIRMPSNPAAISPPGLA
jgi:Phage integrase family